MLLWVIAGLRPTAGLEPWRILRSVSAYYYTGAVAAFVGVLIALAAFLFTYRGYDNKDRRRDRVAAIIAGVAAVVVAFFPTAAPRGLPEPSWWTLTIGIIHYVAAVVLFGSFIFFSLFLFTKSNLKPGQRAPWDKRARNGIYLLCGVAMVGCVLWALGAWLMDGPIFWPEALALEFFAVSWLAKGRADRTAINAGRRTLHYARHPGELVHRARNTIRR